MAKASAELSLGGITGPGLVSKAEETIATIPGVEYAHVNLGAGKMNLNFDDSVVGIEAIMAALTAAGFPVEQH